MDYAPNFRTVVMLPIPQLLKQYLENMHTRQMAHMGYGAKRMTSYHCISPTHAHIIPTTLSPRSLHVIFKIIKSTNFLIT